MWRAARGAPLSQVGGTTSCASHTGPHGVVFGNFLSVQQGRMACGSSKSVLRYTKAFGGQVSPSAVWAGRIPKLERGAVHARRMQKSLNLSQAPTHNCGSLRSLDSQLAGTPSSWLLGSRPSGQQLSQHDVPRGRRVWCRISASVLLRGSFSKRETCFSQTGDDATETSEFHSHVHMLVRGSLV